MQTVNFYILNKLNYPEFRDSVISLYLHAFTTGDFAQHILPETAKSALDGMLSNGSGNMAFIGSRLVGLVITIPLSNDPDFPKHACPEIPVGQTIFFAEVMVHSEYHGRGIASQLIRMQLDNVLKEYTHVVIRVWEKNIPALQLYKKLGFSPIAEISQTKSTFSGKNFEMKKIYLEKK